LAVLRRVTTTIAFVTPARLGATSGTAKSGCPTRARPWPVIRIFHQASSDRVAFDIQPNAIKLDAISDPMIEGFILPEMFPGSPEDLVSLASGNAFETIRNPFDRNRRIEKSMHVVGHDGERPKRVLMQFALASIERRNHAAGNAWLFQPKRPRASFVQSPISLEEILASRRATLPLKLGNDVGR